MTLTCYCCGEKYEQGYFACCAPPRDMKGDEWLQLWCSGCGTHKEHRRCPKHCQCEKPQLKQYQGTAPDKWTPFSGVREDLKKHFRRGGQGGS